MPAPAALAAAASPASAACCSRRSARQAARLSACQPPPAALPPTTSSQPVQPAPAAAFAPAAVAPLSPPLPPAMQAADEWFEVEDLIDQRGRGSSTVYRCRFLGYGEGADLWLPASQISEVALVAWRRGGQQEWRQRQASQPASQVISSPVTMSDNCPTSGGEPAPAAPVRRSRRQAGQPSAGYTLVTHRPGTPCSSGRGRGGVAIYTRSSLIGILCNTNARHTAAKRSSSRGPCMSPPLTRSSSGLKANRRSSESGSGTRLAPSIRKPKISKTTLLKQVHITQCTLGELSDEFAATRRAVDDFQAALDSCHQAIGTVQHQTNELWTATQSLSSELAYYNSRFNSFFIDFSNLLFSYTYPPVDGSFVPTHPDTVAEPAEPAEPALPIVYPFPCPVPLPPTGWATATVKQESSPASHVTYSPQNARPSPSYSPYDPIGILCNTNARHTAAKRSSSRGPCMSPPLTRSSSGLKANRRSSESGSGTRLAPSIRKPKISKTTLLKQVHITQCTLDTVAEPAEPAEPALPIVYPFPCPVPLPPTGWATATVKQESSPASHVTYSPQNARPSPSYSPYDPVN
ncbi:hypothetical protein ACK3TF_004927 [Chlorella vulgaris]